MYLKGIEVQGFKSFANKILFEFKDGITAIVGPNGSGKSNVADAVRWVLGEQSAKQLRGSSMQDVIFSGTEMRKPQGFAYVAITFDNTDHKLPVDYDEVTVARRVYRSGESEYLLNGAGCRLRDVQELFLDTGIGKEGYSIIGQGQIDRIVSGRPEERRELFDEAAGIVKFKKRKAVAEKDLAQEQANLARVQDIIAELEKQVGPLEKQAAVAKEYLKCREELKKVEVNQFILEQEKNTVLTQELEKKKETVSGDLNDTRRAYDNTKAEYERMEQELEQYTAAIDAAKEEKSRLEVEYEKTEGEIRLLLEQMDALLQNNLHFSELLKQVQNNLDIKQKELNEYITKKEEIDKILDALDDEQTKAAEKIQQIREKITQINQEAEEGSSEIFRVLNENSNNKANLERYETIREQNAIQKAELNKRAIGHKSLEAEAEEVVKACRKKFQEALQAAQDKEAEVKNLETAAAQEGQEINEVGKKLEDAQRAFLSDRSRLDSLRDIAERYEGYGGSIRRIMEQKEKFPGIKGVVADLVQVEKNYEIAIETALGASIQNIVTEDEQTAKSLIEFLKKNKAGRATFLPLTSITPIKNNNSAVLREQGVVGLASSLVAADKQYSTLVQFLLGRVIVVDVIDHAFAIARKYSYTLRIVTLAGEQLNPGGSLSGGAYKNSGNLLARRREMEELEERAEREKGQMEYFSDLREKKRARRNELREQAERAKAELRECSIVLNSTKIGLEQAMEKSQELVRQYVEFAEQLRAMEKQTAALQENIRQLSKQCEENVAYRLRLEKRVDECGVLLKEEQKKEQEAQEELSALKVKFSGLEQNSGNILENIQRVNTEIVRFEEEKEKLKKDAEGFEDSRKEKEEELAKKREWREKNAGRTEELAQKIEGLSRQREEKTKLHKGFFAKREELSARIGALDKEVFRLSSQQEKLAGAMEAHIGYLWEEYELTPSAAAGWKQEEFCDPQQNKKRISELKGQIKGLGDVNVNAIEDYRQVSERCIFLSGQRDDLRDSEQALLGIISELDTEMRRQFTEKFAEIAEQFNRVFQELFGGGRAALALNEDEDILLAGIRIIAQPPGKKLQNMMQLSGGEKALTAISLLFAIQNLKPSPFCLLDEIEAALDDSNVKRYAKYLHKLTKDTQFIVITHRRGTMAAADILYGITMQEKGVSTLVSVSLVEDAVS